MEHYKFYSGKLNGGPIEADDPNHPNLLSTKVNEAAENGYTLCGHGPLNGNFDNPIYAVMVKVIPDD